MKKILLLLPIVVIVSAGTAVALYLFAPGPLQGLRGGHAAQAQSTPEPEQGIMFPTAERVVNLADSSPIRYVKVEVILELKVKDLPRNLSGEAYKKKVEELKTELAPVLPKINDTINLVLASKHADDLLKPEGKEALKAELKERLNRAVHEPEVMEIYFNQFIIQ
jgi:flagellar basal body-associated protein FliL